MKNPIKAYTHWLHTRWPAGTVEKLPVVQEGGSTNVPGLYITGDLTGVPLLKFSADSGAKAIQRIVADTRFQSRSQADDVIDIAIVGGGVSGFSAAIEAKKEGLSFKLFEAAEPFSTIVNFPKAKPIYTYPTDMTPAGELQFHEKSEVKEGLLDDLWDQVREAGIEPTIARVSHIERKRGVFHVVIPDGEDVKAHRVIVAIGRSGNFRKLGIPGEDKDKVYNRLHDPKDFCGQDILVVGGGDSAMETAIALASCGSNVTLSYRKPEFSRPKPENVEKINALAAGAVEPVEVETVEGDRVTTPSGKFLHPQGGGSLRLMMASKPREVRDDAVVVTDERGDDQTISNQAVFTMIGREPPLDFFRRSGVKVSGDRGWVWWTTLIGFLLFCVWLYQWKSDTGLFSLKSLKLPEWLNLDTAGLIGNLQTQLGQWASDPANPIGVLLNSMQGRSFYYTLAYASCVVIFGIRRMRRRKTPYIKWQTWTLMVIQVVPLFLLPEFILPWLHGLGVFDSGVGKWIADQLFPGQSWWRAYGLILAWPLMAWNWFTSEPIYAWLVLGFLQTFVLIPAMIYFWGKGAYCGWICSCGALAETLGDTQRQKMPHGPFWNRFNMVGQALLLFAVILMGARIVSWATAPEQSDKSVWATAAVYDAQQDASRADLWHQHGELAGLEKLKGADGSWLDVKVVERERVDEKEGKNVTTILLTGDATGKLNGNATASWGAGSDLHQASSWIFNELSSKDGVPVINWAWFVDLLWAGVIGVGLYFWFSGRVWCRFACPLAALMHIYARFSRFGIIAEKKKCISCNVCTSVCHQGIDIMNFANKGLPMQDPQCVRCSACVQSCPTGVLSFGQVDGQGKAIKQDPAFLAASPVRMAELTVNGQTV